MKMVLHSLESFRGAKEKWNNGSRLFDMSSDPHPEHTDCPEMAAVGFLSPGQSRTSSNFNTARSCGFHDHNEPDTAGLKGRIIIQ